jgi:hypothetical protein
MKYCLLKAQWQKLVFVGGLVLGIALPMASAFAASLAFCQSYARDYSLRYSAKLPLRLVDAFRSDCLQSSTPVANGAAQPAEREFSDDSRPAMHAGRWRRYGMVTLRDVRLDARRSAGNRSSDTLSLG